MDSNGYREVILSEILEGRDISTFDPFRPGVGDFSDNLPIGELKDIYRTPIQIWIGFQEKFEDMNRRIQICIGALHKSEWIKGNSDIYRNKFPICIEISSPI